MSLESVRAWLAEHAPDLPLIEVAESTATVATAALALGVEPGRIAKTLAVRVNGDTFLLVARGDARLDNARTKASLKHGGECQRIDAPDLPSPDGVDQLDLLALDEALQMLEADRPDLAKLVKLRFFAGCSLEDAAQMLGVSRATAQRQWTYARAWLFGRLNDT